jgi:5-formyltetrahydrofolate cyclo-ligase
VSEDAVREQINELRRDLVDGEDLSEALSLVANALHRRIRRVQQSTALLIAHAGHDADTSEEAERLAERISHTLERFREDLQRDHEHMTRVIESYQEQLEDSIEQVDELERGL